jgi:hypothetical protein
MLTTFNKSVLFVSTILLIIGLIVIANFIMKNKETEIYPPVISDCPDYWVDTSGNGSNCINVKYLGNPASTSDYTKCVGDKNTNTPVAIDFSVAPYTGTNGICQKYTWANNCGATWDGITGTDYNPCTANSSTSTT